VNNTTFGTLESENMKIRPLHDRVVVRREEEEETSSGGIVLPGSAKEKPNQGEVLAVGDGKLLDNGEVRPLGVKVGDKVVFGRYADSNTIKDGDDELIIMSESDIYGVIEG
jgi:chaperonin GroES